MKAKEKPKDDKPVVIFTILNNVENYVKTSGKFRTKCSSFRIPGQDSGGANTIYIPYCDDPSSYRERPDWFGVIVPLLISFGLSIIIINNDSAAVLIASWTGLAIAVAWCLFKFLSRFTWRPWQKSIPIVLAPLLVGGLAYGNIRERLKPSFVFVVPGVVLNGDSWDFIVNHRGPKTSYSTQILFQDENRLEYLRRTKQNLTAQDLNSYQTLLSIPEVNPKGRGSIFAKQFQWKPFNFESSRFTAEITWRDGGAHEEIRIVRIQNKWKYAISLNNKETGENLFRCKDDGFPASDAQPSLPSCFPGINSSD